MLRPRKRLEDRKVVLPLCGTTRRWLPATFGALLDENLGAGLRRKSQALGIRSKWRCRGPNGPWEGSVI